MRKEKEERERWHFLKLITFKHFQLYRKRSVSSGIPACLLFIFRCTLCVAVRIPICMSKSNAILLTWQNQVEKEKDSFSRKRRQSKCIHRWVNAKVHLHSKESIHEEANKLWNILLLRFGYITDKCKGQWRDKYGFYLAWHCSSSQASLRMSLFR